MKVSVLRKQKADFLKHTIVPKGQHTKVLWGPAEGHPGSGFCHCFLILARLGAGQKGNPPNKEAEENLRPPGEKLQLAQQLLSCAEG